MKITYSKDARKAIEKLDSGYKRLIKTAVEGLPAGDVVPLMGSNEFRLRVGKYRIIFSKTEETITIIKIDTRGGVYK